MQTTRIDPRSRRRLPNRNRHSSQARPATMCCPTYSDKAGFSAHANMSWKPWKLGDAGQLQVSDCTRAMCKQESLWPKHWQHAAHGLGVAGEVPGMITNTPWMSQFKPARKSYGQLTTSQATHPFGSTMSQLQHRQVGDHTLYLAAAKEGPERFHARDLQVHILREESRTFHRNTCQKAPTENPFERMCRRTRLKLACIRRQERHFRRKSMGDLGMWRLSLRLIELCTAVDWYSGRALCQTLQCGLVG